MMRIIGLSLIATILAVAPVTAQVRADPGVVIGNRVAVRVNVTLADEDTPYYPVRGLMLAFTRAPSDTVLGRTDEAGVVTVLLSPGDYTVTAPTPFAFKGSWYSWSVPVSVQRDMPAVDLSRTNALVASTAHGVAKAPASVTASPGDVANGSSGSRSTADGPVRWLSMEVGGEGGLTRFDDGAGSDPGYGGSGAFVAGWGQVALALGYRYTQIRYGNDLDPGSMRGATLELRYHLRPGTAPVRPYIGAVGSVGRWYDSASLTDESSDMGMLGGTVGLQIGLATSVRLHFALTAAGTNIKTSSESTNNGLFATANLGLTFDIFSPAR